MSYSLSRHASLREASRTRSRISLRNLLVVAVAAVGLSIVPVGIATAATAAGADPYGNVEIVLPG